jgi:hypothetical protein
MLSVLGGGGGYLLLPPTVVTWMAKNGFRWVV